jgi:uncharacterized membrane protein
MDPSQPLPTTPAPPPAGRAAPSDSTAKIVYILYLVSIAVGVTSLIGVIMAYLNVGEAPEPLRSHYRFQIRTFWIGLLYSAIGFVLLFVAVGAVVLLFVAVWLIVRCVKGLKYLDRGEAYPNAASWLW